MIKFEIDAAGRQQIEAVGNEETMAVDTMVLINRIYDSLKQGPGKEVAEQYRKYLVWFLTNEESPLFKGAKLQEQSHGGAGS